MHHCVGLVFLSALVTRCCGATPTPLKCSDVGASAPETEPLVPELEEEVVLVVVKGASSSLMARVTFD